MVAFITKNQFTTILILKWRMHMIHTKRFGYKMQQVVWLCYYGDAGSGIINDKLHMEVLMHKELHQKNYIYCLDITTMNWSKILNNPEDKPVFYSACRMISFGSKLVLFGCVCVENTQSMVSVLPNIQVCFYRLHMFNTIL